MLQVQKHFVRVLLAALVYVLTILSRVFALKRRIAIPIIHFNTINQLL